MSNVPSSVPKQYRPDYIPDTVKNMVSTSVSVPLLSLTPLFPPSSKTPSRACSTRWTHRLSTT